MKGRVLQIFNRYQKLGGEEQSVDRIADHLSREWEVERCLFDSAEWVGESHGDLWTDLWFKATLMDAYFGFITFFVWVAYKELRLWRRMIWFALIMLLGNLAIPAYMLLELYKLQVGDTIETLLTRRNG